MSVVPLAMVEVICQGIANIRGAEAVMPVFILRDRQERSIAIPLSHLEAELLQHTLDGNNDTSLAPQPHRVFLACLVKLGVELDAVRVHHSSDLDMPTSLVLRPRSGVSFEMDIPISDGIIYAHLAGIPIYVSEDLMAEIGANTPAPETRGAHRSAARNSRAGNGGFLNYWHSRRSQSPSE